MCGIVACHTTREPRVNIQRLVYNAIKQLEYRGYDSYGILYADGNTLSCERLVGRISKPYVPVGINPRTAIAHTRWATHGSLTQENCHPFVWGDVWLAHNGQIENVADFICDRAHDVDSAVLTKYLSVNNVCGSIDQLRETLDRVQGRNSFVIYYQGRLVAYSGGMPLYRADFGNLAVVASDLAVFDTIRIIGGDYIVSEIEGLEVIEPPIDSDDLVILEEHRHQPTSFMWKEITEQEGILSHHHYNPIHLHKGTTLVGCGSSYNAALFAKYALPDRNLIVEHPSDFVHRDDSPAVFISQSGHTVDIIDAITQIPKEKRFTVSILTNNTCSPLAKMARVVYSMDSGPEYSVAATKTFTATIVKLLGHYATPGLVSEIVSRFDEIQRIAHSLQHSSSMLLIGNGLSYAVAREVALKVKEISYIHAEAIRAAELKHGPIALIDQNMPVIIFTSSQDVIKPNAEQIAARGGKIVVVSDCESDYTAFKTGHYEAPINTALKSVVFGQLLAYALATAKGLDCDHPRNLAKSVTVR